MRPISCCGIRWAIIKDGIVGNILVAHGGSVVVTVANRLSRFVFPTEEYEIRIVVGIDRVAFSLVDSDRTTINVEISAGSRLSHQVELVGLSQIRYLGVARAGGIVLIDSSYDSVTCWHSVVQAIVGRERVALFVYPAQECAVVMTVSIKIDAATLCIAATERIEVATTCGNALHCQGIVLRCILLWHTGIGWV